MTSKDQIKFLQSSFEGYPLQGTLLGNGKDATAYECGTDLVYRVTAPYPANDPRFEPVLTDRTRREVAAYNDLPEDVQAARVIMGWLSDRRVHKIIERAEGNPLFPLIEGNSIELSLLRSEWEKSVAFVAEIPDAHYERLVKDEAELRKRNILMDYLAPKNLFYSSDKGFTIIDAEFEAQFPAKGKGLYRALIGEFYLNVFMEGTNVWHDSISEESRDSVIKIIGKLQVAGHTPNPRYSLLFDMICRWLEYETKTHGIVK